MQNSQITVSKNPLLITGTERLSPIRPVFLEKDDEIAALVFVIMLSLLIYSIIEMLCRKRQAFLIFEFLSLVCFRFKDGSKLLNVNGLDPQQEAILTALGVPKPDEYLKNR